MTKQQTITYTDDFGGKGEAQPFRFSFEGQVYEVDLNKQHQASFVKTMKRYIEVARPLGTAEANVDYSKVREWARENNIAVSERGLISGEVIRQWTLATA